MWAFPDYILLDSYTAEASTTTFSMKGALVSGIRRPDDLWKKTDETERLVTPSGEGTTAAKYTESPCAP